MGVALAEAKKAIGYNEVPVGCVFIRRNGQEWRKVQSSHNLTNVHKNASRHCEVNCLRIM